MIEDTTPVSFAEMQRAKEQDGIFYFWDSMRQLGVHISVVDGRLRVRPKRKGMISPLLRSEIEKRSKGLFNLLTIGK